MKKIKGGKRSGSGRKKTGRNTEVVSFSIPKDKVEEIKNFIKTKLQGMVQKEEKKTDESIQKIIEDSKKETTTKGLEETVKPDFKNDIEHRIWEGKQKYLKK